MIKSFENFIDESSERTYLYPLKVLAPYKSTYGFGRHNDLEEGEIVYFQIGRFRGIVIIKAYKSVRDGLPGKVDIPKFPYTIHVTKPGIGGFHLNGDILLPDDILQKTLTVVEKYSSPENSYAATHEICDIIEAYSDANARKWKIESLSSKFGL